MQTTSDKLAQAAEDAQASTEELRSAAADAYQRAKSKLEDLAHRGADKAAAVGSAAKERYTEASDKTVAYIRDEPVKSVLIAAAAGALIATIVTALNSRR